MRSSFFRTTLPAITLLAALGIVVVTLPSAFAVRATDYGLIDPIIDIQHLVDEHYYETPDHEAMRLGAIRGMLEALDDPYTEYIPPANREDFDKQVRGEFVGIGAQVAASEDGWLRIVSPLDDSPALLAGLQADDLVVAVDGQSVHGMDVDEIIEQLGGDPGSVVRVTIEREAEAGPRPARALDATAPADAPAAAPGRIRFDVEITRQRIRTSTIRGLHRNADDWRYLVDPETGIAYVRISQFTEDTFDQFPAVMEEALADARGLVLDLRNNTGGALGAALRVADVFLPAGAVIVSTEGRTSTRREEVATPAQLPDMPMVVLVNRNSASASEIVAGALADHGRAKVLGERTFGKGLVQTLRELPSSDGELKVTEAYYALPSGRNLHRFDDSKVWGVDPSDGFYVPVTNTELRTLWRIRQNEEVLRPTTDADPALWSDTERILEHLQDPQLTAAVEALRARIETGTWAAPGADLPEHAMDLEALREERERFEILERELIRVSRRIRALEDVDGAAELETSDLLPDDARLTGGTVEVRGADGEVVGRMRITGEGLERWLLDAPVEPAESDEAEVEPETAGAP